VVQYNNGSSPVLIDPHHEDNNDLYALYLRERYYWSDTYYYYLCKEYTYSVGGLPFYKTYALWVAQKFSNGGVKLDFHQTTEDGSPVIVIDETNPIKSVSLFAHDKTGRDLPKERQFGWFESLPRGWRYSSGCQYVLETGSISSPASIWSLVQQQPGQRKGSSFEELSHCDHLDDLDEELHRKMRFNRDEDRNEL
jgi:hypothetical protein